MTNLQFIGGMVCLVGLLIWNAIRPRNCFKCGARFWRNRMNVVVVSGSGPETCETGLVCDTCYKRRNQ